MLLRGRINDLFNLHRNHNRMQYHTIALFPKLQPDTLLALFLLKKFGEKKFPGVSQAKLKFWTQLPQGKTAKELESSGHILIDIGEGFFDHHRENMEKETKRCVSEIIADYLGIADDSALKKLLAYARRDDLEGKGTISSDPLDRAFGLSGILMNLNKSFPEKLEGIANLVLDIYEAHYVEEEKRTRLMPEEWKKLKGSGKAKEWSLIRGNKQVRIVLVQTDNQSLPGFLRAYIHVDIVIVRTQTGHANIITQQKKPLDLSGLVAKIRHAEAEKRGVKLDYSEAEWQKPGILAGIPEWFYDTAANSIQNGGIKPQNVPATKLTDEDFQELLK